MTARRLLLTTALDDLQGVLGDEDLAAGLRAPAATKVVSRLLATDRELGDALLDVLLGIGLANLTSIVNGDTRAPHSDPQVQAAVSRLGSIAGVQLV